MAGAVGSDSQHFQLVNALLARSHEALTWAEAAPQWTLSYIEHLGPGQPSQHCLCSHEIREICHISNIRTGKTAIVGNVCIHTITGTRIFDQTNSIVTAFKRIKKDNSKSANLDLIDYAYRKGIFSSTERVFYKAIWRKRNLAEEDSSYKKTLNARLIEQINTHQLEVVSEIDAQAEEASDAELEQLRATDTPPSAHAIENRTRAIAIMSLFEDRKRLLKKPKSPISQELVIKGRELRLFTETDKTSYLKMLEKASNEGLSFTQFKWIERVNKKLLNLTFYQLAVR